MSTERGAVVLSPAERPRLIFFYSARDGRARRIEGYLAQVLQRRQNHDTFAIHRVDVDERPEVAERFRVNGEPALLVVSGKAVRARLEAPRGCAEIQTVLAPWLR
jgi:thioredoxin-like negative regulator of GroEL